MSERSTVLVSVHGPDHPGISAALMDVLSAGGAEVHDIEQIVVRGKLTLNVRVGVDGPDDWIGEIVPVRLEPKAANGSGALNGTRSDELIGIPLA